ncbi:DNRLRE domain-containing protein [Actinoplanes sp. NPDC051494]|uniref:CBM96 family carbohydrate-binding protein n=1 Tax=Actinoplanes sp. NPDC051494 TaxID=3363907 RepID=UPI00378C2B39
MTARRGMIGAAVTGVVVAGASVALTGTANAAPTNETISVHSSDDAYTSSTRTGANFGQSDKLVVGKEAGETRLSYVKFAPKVPAGGTVTGAELRLPVESKPAESTLTLYAVPSSWSEKTLTAANAPALGAAVASIKAKATDTTLTFDLSKVVNNTGTYAFALKSSATSAVTRLRSTEYGNAATGGPELRLTVRTSNTPTTAPTSPAPTSPAPTPTTAPPTTVPPTTTPPTTTPPTSAPPTKTECVTDAKLVPTCGVLWGAAAGGFTDAPRDQALKDWEKLTGRTAAIFHAYHKGDEKFPTKAEIAMTRDPEKPRVLLLNWKIAYQSTWAKVAAGEENKRIDAWSDYVKKNYDQKFYLVLNHEPENDVIEAADKGMTAKDFANMYRYVIKRLRANGVTDAINVMAYMGNEKWMAKSWWKDLYPGDDVVDWVGLDSYVSVEKGYYHYGDMGDLLDRKPTGGGLGWYDWAVTNHPGKPIMVAEWGMYHRTKSVTDKSAAYNTVVPELKAHPGIKAVVYFDTASDDEGDRDISVNSTATGLAAFRKVAADPMFTVTIK